MWLPDNSLEFAAIEELKTATDRAAGIIAATIVESRLTTKLKQQLHNDDAVQKEMFQSIGPLGTLSAKIKLGYLIKMYSNSTYSDLDYIRRIRNEFAHNLSATSFSADKIHDLCNNLKLVENFLTNPGEKTPAGLTGLFHKDTGEVILVVSNKESELMNPRARYIRSTQIISSGLSSWADLGFPVPKL